LHEPSADHLESHSHRLVWAAVAAGLAALAVLSLLPDRNRNPTASLTAEATAIRRQHELLTQELNRLRVQTENTAPVLYLGDVDEIDYVLDVSPFLSPADGRVMPASTKESPTY
jgi:hypothetical protein